MKAKTGWKNFKKAALGAFTFSALTLAALTWASPDPAVSDLKIAVIVKAGGTLANLQSKDIRAIYLGDKSFEGSTKIMPLVNLENSLAEVFMRKVLNKSLAQYQKIWNGKAFIDGLTAPQIIPTGLEVMQTVRESDSAIGFVPEKKLTKNDKSLKVIYLVDTSQ